MFYVLQVFQANIEQITSDHLAKELKRLNRASMHFKPQLQNVGTSDSSISCGYANDIEAEAGSYLYQMFSGQMPITVMIQMLSQFKKSSKKRFIINLSTRNLMILCHIEYILASSILVVSADSVHWL